MLNHKQPFSQSVPDITMLLISRGAMVNATDNKGRSPLLESIKGNLPHVALALVENGAAIDAVDENGNTPLLESFKQKLPHVAVCLLQRGANIDSNIGCMPLLHRAAQEGWTQVCEMLLKSGAKADSLVKIIVRGKDGIPVGRFASTPLHIACEWGHFDTAVLLLKWISIEHVFLLDSQVNAHQ